MEQYQYSFVLDESLELREFELEFIQDEGRLIKYKLLINLEISNEIQIYLYYNADYLRAVEISLINRNIIFRIITSDYENMFKNDS